MAHRGRTTSNKRMKEQQRKERAMEKAARRQERKLEKENPLHTNPNDEVLVPLTGPNPELAIPEMEIPEFE